MEHEFPHTEGKIWIFLPGIVQFAGDTLIFDGRFLVFEHHGKDLIPVAKGKYPRRMVEPEEDSITFVPDGGTICQVHEDILRQSRMEW